MRDDNKLAVIVMAAGKGTRMKSELPKVLHLLNGKPLLAYPLTLAKQINSSPIVVVVGYQADMVRQAFKDETLTFALQEPQLGTGHAVMCALPGLDGFAGHVLILNGDVPGLKLETIKDMLAIHHSSQNSLTVLGMQPSDAGAYGRMVVHGDRLLRIVEFRDASEAEKQINLVNAGIYLVEYTALANSLNKLTTDNDQHEYYLTDLVDIMNKANLRVGYYLCTDPWQVAGVNSQEELHQLETLLGRD